MNAICRDAEIRFLESKLQSDQAEFIAVYGRRRVGKTFLIRETFENRFDFQFTGAANLTARKQLVRFRRALKEHGQKDTPEEGGGNSETPSNNQEDTKKRNLIIGLSVGGGSAVLIAGVVVLIILLTKKKPL